MKIGNINIFGYAALAPMAGVADRAFREVCKDFGASYVTTEMVSAKALVMQDNKSKQLLSLSEKEQPAAAQLFGNEPQTMALAAKKAMSFSPRLIDINMGCPAPKIAGNGNGSALMKDPELCGKIVKAVVDAVDVPVTVKMRTGWDSDNLTCVEIAQICEESGASAITIHGRTRQQMYAPPVDYARILKVKQAVKIPVIGNGDITDGKSAEAMLEKTGCDFLAVGRGALGAPWVFEDIKEYFEKGIVNPPRDIEYKMAVLLRHIALLCEYKGERTGMCEARKHSAWYIKGIKGAAGFRNEIGKLEHMEQLEKLIRKVINSTV